MIPLALGPWDWALILTVATQSTAIAYMHSPRWKGLLLSLPFPFTLAVISVGQPINVTHVLGLLMFFLFTHAVRWLHLRLKLPIVLSIVLAAAAYGVLAMSLVKVLPLTESAFWVGVGVTLVIGLLFAWLMPYRDEAGSKTTLPPWLKFPLVFAVVFGIVLLKKQLQGFMALFPMVSIVAMYESRFCLWSVCRQMAYCLFSFLAMQVIVHIAQAWIPFPWVLIVGWLIFIPMLSGFTRRQDRCLQRATG